MRKLQYLVKVNRDTGSEWGTSVPDLPGCVATGKTLDVVMRRIQAAVQFHVCGLREDGDAIPRPRNRVVRPTRSAKQVEFYATVEAVAWFRWHHEGRLATCLRASMTAARRSIISCWSSILHPSGSFWTGTS